MGKILSSILFVAVLSGCTFETDIEKLCLEKTKLANDIYIAKIGGLNKRETTEIYMNAADEMDMSSDIKKDVASYIDVMYNTNDKNKELLNIYHSCLEE